jgi:hypothetical protein
MKIREIFLVAHIKSHVEGRTDVLACSPKLSVYFVKRAQNEVAVLSHS